MSLNPLQNSPIVFTDSQERDISEVQVISADDIYKRYEILGDPVEITAGFMESSGHGNKT